MARRTPPPAPSTAPSPLAAGAAALTVVLAVLSAGPGAAVAQDVPPLPPDWQQEVRYTVEGRLDEDAGRLEAAAVVRYANHSPDTLRSLYFHLYLNAFRPHSVWARNEQRARLDFGALEEPDYGYERLRSVRLTEGPGSGEGGRLTPRYPHAPDSTVVRLELPEPLPPGGELTLRMRWDARPATLCRRQCRQGRSWDFAQWYPRAAVYDWGGWEAHPLHPQGEFYGEFGVYDVTLDLAEDQVVGATGVPVEGDPGWEPAPGSPLDEPLHQRDWYGEDPDRGPSPGLLRAEPRDGRKRVRFRAERVHHFAWSVSPEYVYEGGVLRREGGRDVAIHVLSRPADDDWRNGVAVERTMRALRWLEGVFAPYPYPQLTNLHRLEGGGTEFPMVIMDGSASEGLIVHETTHQYAHGILANNEWKEAWMDEGLTSFLDGWYAEEHGASDPWRGALERMARTQREWERLARVDTGTVPRPIATRSELFMDYGRYGTMSYTKPSLVFRMLRGLVGEETFREVLKEYYRRYAFRHVNEAAFRSVAEEVSGRELGWFFDQWLHTTDTLDYRLGRVSTEQLRDGRWRTRAVVFRDGDAWMPVALRVGDTTRRLTSKERRQEVEVVTESRPAAVVIDPGRLLMETDFGNNRKELSEG